MDCWSVWLNVIFIFFEIFLFFLSSFLLIHAADQAVIVELRNQIHLLKNQHHDQLEQLNRERKWRNNEKCHDIRTSSSHHSLSNSVSRRFIFSADNDKFQKEMTIALAEKENQFQQQVRKQNRK